jgi:ribose transport system substrate-binding protein
MQFPVLMARTSADLADSYIKGERNFSNKTPVEVVLITSENVSKYLQEK